MSKIKVLQFPATNSRSGMTQYMLQNWNHINRDIFQFDFATLSKKLDFEAELREQGCNVHYISCYAEDNREQFIKEMNEILQQGYDIVHLHTSYWKSFLVEELALAHHVPKIIVHSHSTMVDIADDQAREKAIELHERRRSEFTPSFATDFWACSQVAAEWLFGEQIPQDRIKLLKNAVDVDQFAYDDAIRHEYRHKLDFDREYVIGHVGRFVYQKNHTFLIDMFYQVSRRVPHAKLLLIGIGELEQTIRDQVQVYGLENKVIFLGKRNDVDKWFQAMDQFVLPSHFEGLPIVLVEAQASGLNCITSTSVTREVAITDHIRFEPLVIDSWVEAIVRDSGRTARENSRTSIANAGFDIKLQIKELERMYMEGFERGIR